MKCYFCPTSLNIVGMIDSSISCRACKTTYYFDEVKMNRLWQYYIEYENSKYWLCWERIKDITALYRANMYHPIIRFSNELRLSPAQLLAKLPTILLLQ